MLNLQRITFSYVPAEAEIPIVAWFLDKLDKRLKLHEAYLTITDMKFGRSGLDISWYLSGNINEDLEEEIEEQLEWVCRKVNRTI